MCEQGRRSKRGSRAILRGESVGAGRGGGEDGPESKAVLLPKLLELSHDAVGDAGNAWERSRGQL